MPDISKIKLPGDNNTYDISDLVARGLLCEISQADYNALVQAGTVDPNVYYYIYDAAGTELPIDTSLDTTSSNAIANGPVASAVQTISQTVSNKMDKANPTGTGSLSLNRKAGTGTGNYSVAVGENNEASGAHAFAEGLGCKASGDRAHAEGYNCTASGATAHVENSTNVASGNQAHAEGYGNEANHLCQHVFGQYNVADTSTAAANARGNYVEIVGNGTNTNSRSNARTLDWNGNETLAGGLKINGNQDVTIVGSFSNDITTTADGLAAVTIPSGVSINNIFAIIVQNPASVYLYGFLIKQPAALWANIRNYNGTAYASQSCTIKLFYYK